MRRNYDKLRSCILLAATICGGAAQAATVIADDFTATDQDPFTGSSTALTWTGDLAELELAGNRIQQDTSQVVSTITTNISTIDSLGLGEIYQWVGQVGRVSGSMTVTDENWGGIVISSDSSDAAAIEAGTMNGYRLVLKDGDGGDFVALEQASGSGWSQIARDDQANAAINMATNPVMTITLDENGVFDFNVVLSAGAVTRSGSFDTGGAITLDNFSGFTISSGASPRLAYLDDFSLSIEAIPEPATLSLISLAGFGFILRRRT
ncbi:PEP-CTERM sorting domain-containing protein [Persicirhabdus sediminis]|uniref:PEP-CTERM sorting domain-containing protein n=1 Tax=Persicirhabdus sediminis TaxID=454144 RepID=A0A8J7MCY8_9BACT|nr:PEP-CTERM sorting domain-containing protein [Persicirhabdus sediminis]MBK1791454.1 PEP-CTERM sorting domain-containing protein [Persicirhabdus sediminis]